MARPATAQPRAQLGNRLFDHLDSNKRGLLTWQQFTPFTAKVGWKEDVALQMWYDTDKDRSGTLDRSEFLAFCANPGVTPYVRNMEATLPAPAPPAAPGSRLFDFIDGKTGGQRNGVVEWTEFLPLIQTVGWPEEVARRMWFDTDTDRSGTLDRAEWMRFCGRPDVSPHIARLEARYCGGAAVQQHVRPQGMPYQGGGSRAVGGQQQQQQQQGGGQGAGFSSTCTGTKKAVFIGINYTGTQSALRGCINDVKNIRQFVQRCFGFRDELIVQLTDDTRDPKRSPTRRNIIQALHWLVQGARPGDSLFLHYSGHGGSVKDQNGDEEDGMDETICPLDFRTAGQIIDDDLHDILVKPLPRGVRLTAIFDSCHSGSVMDLPFTYNVNGNLSITMVDNRKKAIESGGRAIASLARGNKLGALFHGVSAIGHLLDKGNPQAKARAVAEKRSDADVIQFSGCRDDQTSADANIGGSATGAMSWAFIKVLSQGQRLTYTQLLGQLRQALMGKYSQVPQMSTGREMNMQTTFLM